MASIGGFMSILCIFSVISKGWTLLDALSYIVHLYQQFGKEINQDLQLSLWDTCGMVFLHSFFFCYQFFSCFMYATI